MLEFMLFIFFLLFYVKLNTLEEKLDVLLDKRKCVKEEVAPVPHKEETFVRLKEETLVVESLKPLSKEKSSFNLEALLFGNIILKIGVLAFIIGVGLFLKYSIDNDWIPLWSRAMIGVAVGIVMILGGTRLIDNPNRLFFEGLFGGGIAILYLSIYAGFALEGFKFLSFSYAFVAMVAITILALWLSLKFNAKSTAVFGLIGGFMTPFFINKGTEDMVALLSYMLVLNGAVLYLSVYQKWSILAWMAFVITALTQLVSTFDSGLDFMTMIFFYGVFFVIYSIVPFINEIKTQQEGLKQAFLMLFSANTLVVLGSFYIFLDTYNVPEKRFALVTLSVAMYLLVYAGILAQKKSKLKNLFYLILSQAMALILLTPAIVFDGLSLTIIWSVESLMLLWIAHKSDEVTYAYFALVGFVLTVGRYIALDLGEERYTDILAQLKTLSIGSFFVLGSLLLGVVILHRTTLGLNAKSQIKNTMLSLWVILFFIYLNIQTQELTQLFYPEASKFAITLLWIVFGIVLFVVGVIKEVNASKLVATGLIFLAILKAFFSDLARLDSLYKIILFMILGVLLFGLSYFYQKKSKNQED